MALATKVASLGVISPANVVNLNGHKDVRFNISKPRTVLPSISLVSKLCSLTISCKQAYTMPLCGLRSTNWNFPSNPRVDSADEAEVQKHARRACVQVFFAREEKNVQKLAKSNRPMVSTKERNPKRLSSSASTRIELDYFQVLKYPLVTELAMQEMLQKNTLVFVVNKHADKKNIKAAVEKISNVQTKKVNSLVMPNGCKKAYIKLRPNYSALEVAKKLGIL